jgi:hypothetical protein
MTSSPVNSRSTTVNTRSSTVEPVALSFFFYRRQLRQELHLQRVKDKSYGDARMAIDQKSLDAQLVSAGYKLIYPTEWRQKTKTRPLQAITQGLNKELIGQGQLELMGAV